MKQNVKRLWSVCVWSRCMKFIKRWVRCGGHCINQKVSITWQIWVNTSSGDLSASICKWNQKCHSYNVYCGTCSQMQTHYLTSTDQNTILFVQCNNILEAVNMQHLRLHNNTAFDCIIKMDY